MKNLNFGHADSVGFFQMRVGIWNQGAYAGYPEKPELQVKWFLDQAEAVKSQRLVAGKPIDDPNQLRRVDRRRRAPRRAVPRALPDQARGGQRPARVRRPPARRGRAPVAAAPVDPAAAAASAAAVGNAKLPPEILGPVQEAIAAGNAPGPEGAGRDRGGVEVPRHRLQVGRLDAADRLRLLRADAVVLRAVRRADPARDLHADRGAERHRGRRPHGPQARRPRVLLQRRRRPPRRHVPRRPEVPARAEHRRRGQGLEPRASRTTRASSPAAAASTTARRSPPRRPPRPPRRRGRRGRRRRPDRGRQGAGRGRARRGRGPPPGLRSSSMAVKAEEATKEGEKHGGRRCS